MNPTSTEKQKKEKEQNTEENETTTGHLGTLFSLLPFSYTLAQSIRKRHAKGVTFNWNILEKGTHVKLKPKYEISYDKIKSAASEIREYILKTPCSKNLQISADQPFEIYVKKEYYQLTRSVKARGVLYTLLQLSSVHKHNGVIAISTGNFALTLCSFGSKLHIPVTIVMPKSSAFEAIEKLKEFEQNSRIRVFIQGCDMLEAHNIAIDIAAKEGLCYIDGNNHPNMIIGQATLGIEIMEQMGKVDAVLLPIALDVTGFTAAFAMAIKGSDPSVKVIEVRIPIVDSLMNIRNRTYSTELDIPVTCYQVPQSCYKDLSENLIDMIIHIKPDIISYIQTDIKLECCFEFCAGIGLLMFFNNCVNMLQGNRVVVPLLGQFDVDSILTNEPEPAIVAALSKLLK